MMSPRQRRETTGEKPELFAALPEDTLLEREALVEYMVNAFRQACQGAGQVVILSGEAGAGKSTLAQHVLEHHTPHAEILRGYCEAMFTPRPLGAFDEAFTHLGLKHSARDLDYTSVNLLFPTLLDKLSQTGRPVVLLIEDVHWADNLSLDLIRYIARRIGRLSLLMILTVRSESLSAGSQYPALMQDLPRQHLRSVELPPLSRTAVAFLARSVPQWAAPLFEVTGGNPFFVRALLQATIELGALPDMSNLPQVVSDRIMAKLRELPQATRQTIEFLSVIPGLVSHAFPKTVAESGETIDGSALCLPAAIAECIQFNLLKSSESGFLFVHEIVRVAIEASIPPMLTREFHRLALRVLSRETGVSKARLAHHAKLAQALERLPEDALEAAVEASQANAFTEAVAHYETAISLAASMEPAQRARALAGWAYARSIAAGPGHLCLQRLREAAEIWRSIGDLHSCGTAYRRLSTLQMFKGEVNAAFQSARDAVAVLESLPHDAALAMAYSQVAHCLMARSDRAGTELWSARAITLGEKLASSVVLAHARINLGTALFRSAQGKQVARGLRLLQDGLALSLRDHFVEPALLGHMNLAEGWLVQFNTDQAHDALIEGMSYATDTGLLRQYFVGLQAQVALHRGQIQQARQQALHALENDNDLAPSSIVQWPLLLAWGLASARLSGDPEASTVLTQAYELSLKSGLPRYFLPSGLALIEYFWISGDKASADKVLQDCWTGRVKEENPWLLGALCVWAKRLEISLEGAPAMPVQVSLAAPFQLELKGDIAGAANAWKALNIPYERALALMQGDHEQLAEAIRIFSSLGAEPAMQAARRLASEQGLQKVPRGAYRFSREHPLGLTAKETQVFQFLIEGLSNAGIASQLKRSERTVEHHVSAILAKSGLKSRNDLVVALRAGRLPTGLQ